MVKRCRSWLIYLKSIKKCWQYVSVLWMSLDVFLSIVIHWYVRVMERHWLEIYLGEKWPFSRLTRWAVVRYYYKTVALLINYLSGRGGICSTSIESMMLKWSMFDPLLPLTDVHPVYTLKFDWFHWTACIYQRITQESADHVLLIVGWFFLFCNCSCVYFSGV